jgi:hypothetical protein
MEKTEEVEKVEDIEKVKDVGKGVEKVENEDEEGK